MKQSAVRFNPFPGLRSFEPHEEHIFFGREQQTDELLKKLRRTRFLAVIGISGSGKSSLVLSGLIPSLHRGLMTRAGSAWRVAVFRPGNDPIGNLAQALSAPNVLGEVGERAEVNRALLEATLRRGTLGLVESIREAREVRGKLPKYDNLLVVVDQFEELFRFKTSARTNGAGDEALAFVRLLQEAAQHQELPIYVVLTMRTDFMEHCVEFPGLPEAINDGAYLVSRLNREEQRAAIVGPVAVAGGEIAPRLVLRLLNSVGDDPDQLPVLQHALMRTWDFWDRQASGAPALDLEHYEAVGTMERALSQHAEEVFEALGSEDRRRIAEKMFKALTDKVPGRRGVRRPVKIRELCELTRASPEEVIAVADCFRQPGRSFLMPPPGIELDADSVIDISHESLMRIWDRLLRWVEEETESAQSYLRLARAVALREEGSAGLWRDPELEFALQWRDKNQPTEVWARRYDPSFGRAMRFLDQSAKARERERAAEERARRKKLRQARILAAISLVVALVILGFGLYAIEQRNEARKQQNIADQERRTAQQERETAERERERAKANEQEAVRQQQETEEQRRKAVAERARAEDERARAEDQTRIAEANRRRAVEKETEARAEQDRADQARRAAEAAEQDAKEQRAEAIRAKVEAESLRIRELARALAVQTPRLLQEAEQRELAALLAVQAYHLNREHGGEPEEAAIYDGLWRSLLALDPERGAGIDLGSAVRAVALAPDGTLAAGAEDGSLYLRRPGEEPMPVAWPADETAIEDTGGSALGGDAIRSLAVSPTGRWLAGGTLSGALLLWDLETGEARRLGEHRTDPEVDGDAIAAVSALAFDPSDGLFSGSFNGEVRRWDLADGSGEVLLDAGEPPLRILALAVSGDGSTLAAAREGRVAIRNLRQPQADPAELAGARACRALAFSRDGTTLACGGGDGAIRLWDLSASPAVEREPLLGHTSSVNALRFSPGRDLLASASADKSLRLWSYRDRDAEPIVLTDHTSWVWTLAWSADGAILVSGSSDRTVRTWETRNRLLVDEICRRLARPGLSREEWDRYIGSDVPHEVTCPGLPATAQAAGGS